MASGRILAFRLNPAAHPVQARIFSLIEKSFGGRAKHFSEATGIPVSTMSHWFTPGRNGEPAMPGQEHLAAIAVATGRSVEWLRTGEQAAGGGRSIPILACVNAQAPDGVCYVAEGASDFVAQFQLPEDAHLARVFGDSMASVILDGQMVLCTNETPQSGDLAVIETSDDRLLVKRIYITDGEVLCISLNHDPKFKPIRIPRDQVRRWRKVRGILW